METEPPQRTSLSSVQQHQPQQQNYYGGNVNAISTSSSGYEMSERPPKQNRMRSVSVVAYHSTAPMNGRSINNNNNNRALMEMGVPGGRKPSSAGGRRISLPNNLRRLPMRKKSTGGGKFKSMFQQPAIDPWDEIFMIYVSLAKCVVSCCVSIMVFIDRTK